MTNIIERMAMAIAARGLPERYRDHGWAILCAHEPNMAAKFRDDARAALTALGESRLVPEVWSDDERDQLSARFAAANAKHGHYETTFAVAAEGIRIAQDRMIKAAQGGDQ